MTDVKITKIKAIGTAPAGVDLVLVKVETNQPGLYGLGCATYTQRYAAVTTTIREYIAPIFEGRCVNNIEDAWQTAMGSGYWRNGPIFNNAVSGLDEALWDIKGKMAGMPVYELLGGKCREGVSVYRHADGGSVEEVEDNIRKFMDMGIRYVRCQQGVYGGTMGSGKQTMVKPDNAPYGTYFDPKQYVRTSLKLFERIRVDLGDELEILHDVHERLTPNDAMQFAKEVEQYKLFYLEDALAPEHVDWFNKFRQVCATPIAMGELFVHPMEWKSLIANRAIDYIRCHISMIGGLTPAIKLAHFCDAFGVRTAWHGPNDITPVGVAAQLHLDLASPNFGIQEFFGFTDLEKEIFVGAPELRNGYLYANDKPGFGIEFNEELALKYPCQHREHAWLLSRLPDGTAVRP